MAEREHAPEQASTEDEPSLRQRLHAATGDRDAEAKAVADRDEDVSERDAKVAEQRARGERGIGTEPEPEHELVTVDDAEAVADDDPARSR
jgi:hypothetical protein